VNSKTPYKDALSAGLSHQGSTGTDTQTLLDGPGLGRHDTPCAGLATLLSGATRNLLRLDVQAAALPPPPLQK
jgi:hypothetical protein